MRKAGLETAQRLKLRVAFFGMTVASLLVIPSACGCGSLCISKFTGDHRVKTSQDNPYGKRHSF